MKRQPLALCVLFLWAGFSASLAAEPDVLPVPADPYRFYVHVGAGALILDESADISVGGATVPGGDIEIDSPGTLIIEAGYFFLPDFAVSFTAGIPPTSDIEAAGTLAGAGRMGNVTYGPTALTVHYHGLRFGPFQPYFGAGITYMPVFDADGALLAGLEVDSAFGAVFQAGVDVMLDDRFGLFLDVKKAILRTDATGTFGGFPAEAEVTLDPLVIHGGLTIRY